MGEIAVLGRERSRLVRDNVCGPEAIGDTGMLQVIIIIGQGERRRERHGSSGVEARG